MAETKVSILAAARAIVLAEGYAALSTRKVAELAGVPLSQLHYHFGSKARLVLATLEAEDARLLHRQEELYAGEEPLSAQWRRACDYFDQDLESGYVRLLHELMAAGWSNAALNAEIRRIMDGWRMVLIDAFRRAEARGVSFAPFTVDQVEALTGAMFVGAESMILSSLDSRDYPIREALRAVGDLLELAESRASVEVST